MPGIFDVLAAQGILSQLFGNQAQGAQPVLDTGDDTQRMLAKQRAILSGQGSVTNPPPEQGGEMAYPNEPVPMMVQAMQNGGVPQAPATPAPAPIVNAAGTTQTPGEFGNPLAAFGQAAASPSGVNKFSQALNIIGRGLMTAGSKDPAATAAEFAKLEHEIGKPKVVPLANGAFSMVIAPDGSTKIVKNEDVAQYLSESNDMKKAFELLKIDRRGEVQKTIDQNKSDIKTGAETRPLLSDTETLIDRWKQAGEMIKGQGTWAQVQGAFPSIAGFFGTDDVAKNKFLQGLAVDETLLNTAKTKGAISDKEMALFKTPIPSLTDDREKVWKPYIEARLPVLEKLRNFYQSEVGRSEGASAPAAPKASNAQDYSAQAKSAWGSYDPDQYEYRMNNGVLQRRKK